MTASAMSSTWGIQLLFAETRLRKTKRFYDELSVERRKPEPIRAFQVEVIYKLIEGAINQLTWQFQEQKQVAKIFNFLFPHTMLQLKDTELE